MADIFISYSSEDKAVVKQIAGLLQSKGWTVWWDRQIPIGQKYDTVIETELHNAGCVLVIWTQKSIASEWVKNEASEAAQKGLLVPVVLEQVELPLAFKRIESAMLIGWNGEQNHPELELLFGSIENILTHKNVSIAPVNVKDTVSKNRSTTSKKTFNTTENKPATGNPPAVSRYGIIAIIGFVLSLALVYYYLQFVQGKVTDAVDQRMFYLILILFGISASAIIFGATNTYAVIKGKRRNVQFKMVGPGVGVVLVVLGGLYLPAKATEKNVTIRLFDWKKNPITQGEVKIYLKEYIRNQSIDKMGQALFTGIPDDVAKNKMKIEVSSPGYTTKSFDTLLINSKPLELTLPLTTVVIISGKVKKADETPIKDVEINVDGTRYYAMSINDGTYSLRLEEYTLGDEVKLTTSHKDFEDKTTSLLINSPDIKNQDIFLNPIPHKKLLP
jgi:TIR domain